MRAHTIVVSADPAPTTAGEQQSGDDMGEAVDPVRDEAAKKAKAPEVCSVSRAHTYLLQFPFSAVTQYAHAALQTGMVVLCCLLSINVTLLPKQSLCHRALYLLPSMGMLSRCALYFLKMSLCVTHIMSASTFGFCSREL